MSYRAVRKRAGWVPGNDESRGRMFDGIGRRREEGRGALDGGKVGVRKGCLLG